MKIVFDTEKNTVKVGSKTFGVDMPIEKQNTILSYFNDFVKKSTSLTDFDGYEEDSMWMSYRYCIGRHTIAAHIRAGDIGTHCYGRMTKERSVFTAYDINREIKMDFSKSEGGPSGGFMMSLAIYSKLVEDLTDGRKIVGTGTIDSNGNVGEIGGVKYKIMGAVKNKADVFFVPENMPAAIAATQGTVIMMPTLPLMAMISSIATKSVLRS